MSITPVLFPTNLLTVLRTALFILPVPAGGLLAVQATDDSRVPEMREAESSRVSETAQD